jgi:hypothetical protein
MKQKQVYLQAFEQLVRALYAEGDGRDKSQKWALALAHTRGFAQASRKEWDDFDSPAYERYRSKT